MDQPGPISGHFVAMLGLSWAKLEPFGSSWGYLEGSLGDLGLIFGDLGAILVHFGALLEVSRPILALSCGTLGLSWASWDPIWGFAWAKKTLKSLYFHGFRLMFLLRPFACGFLGVSYVFYPPLCRPS